MDGTEKEPATAPTVNRTDAGVRPSPPNTIKSPPANTVPSPGGKPPMTEPQRQARTVRDAMIPGLMQAAMAPKGTIDGKTARGYRDELLREMGNPTDALERMLIEQAVLAHVVIMQLHATSALSESAEAAGVYSAAAARLMAELRRTILAVREYRTPPTRPVVTRIEQQNVAHSQAVSYVAGKDDHVTMSCREKTDADGKQVSDSPETDDGEANEIPCSRSRWAQEPAAAGAAHD